MLDDDTTAHVRDRLTSAAQGLTATSVRPPASQIIARGHGRRLRHRLTTAAAAGTAVAAALVLTMWNTTTPGTSGTPGTPSVHVNLAAWSVNTNSRGDVYLTVHELQDAPALERALGRAGVPALVTFDKGICDGYPSLPQASARVFLPGPGGYHPHDVSIIIHRAALPDQARVVISMYPAYLLNWQTKHVTYIPHAFEDMMDVVPDSSHIACYSPLEGIRGVIYPKHKH